jgi:hypothetical protein
MKTKAFILTSCLILISLFINGCNAKKSSINYPITSSEIDGSQTERIGKIMRLVDKSGKLKANVKNAYLIEQKIGDGFVGSADYVSFIALDIDKLAIPTWRKLAPKSNQHSYISPPKEVSWWVSQEEFKHLEFIDAFPIISQHGWVGISNGGKVYIYGFTT